MRGGGCGGLMISNLTLFIDRFPSDGEASMAVKGLKSRHEATVNKHA